MIKLPPPSHAAKRRMVQRRRMRRQRQQMLLKLVEHKLVHKATEEEYRHKVRDVYDGPQGAMLATASMLSLHLTLGEMMLRERRFDLTGCKRILDVGSGAGQIAKHVLKYADPDAELTCSDLSWEMLRRARTRLRSDRPNFLTADLAQLPFADGAFDCITCGYVLEHLRDPRPGLQELARVLEPGGRMLLLTTEDKMAGAWTSRFWCCRTYNRRELEQVCQECGLVWKQELWFSKVHKAFRAGGICVWIEKAPA